MRFHILGIAAVAGIALTSGCTGSDGGGNPFTTGGAGTSATGSAGTGAGQGTAGTSAGQGTAGTSAGQGTAGTTAGQGTAGTGAGTAGTGAGTAGTGAGTAGTMGAGGTGVVGNTDITKVVPTTGCGMAPPAAFVPGTTSGAQTITTMGTKPAGCADSKCGAWMYDRQ